MERIINVEILGRPVNTFIIILMIVAFWFSVYSIKMRGAIAAAVAPDTTEGN